MLDHLEVTGHVFEHFAAIVAEGVDSAAAVRAGGSRGMHHRLARQVAGQPAAGWLLPGIRRGDVAGFGTGFAAVRRFGGLDCRRRRGRRHLARLDLLDRQLQLRHLARELLRRLAELHPAQFLKLHLQLLDLERLQLQRFIGEVALGAALAGDRTQADYQFAQAVSIVRKRRGFINHVNHLP